MFILYTPRGRAREYAPLAVNLYSGCSHGCKYCYVPDIPPWEFSRTPRLDFHSSVKPRKDVIKKLERDLRSNPGNGERVMLCFTTDPYQNVNNEHGLTRKAIKLLHRNGYNVQVLTKGGQNALADLDIFTENDAFATTMTLLSDASSQKWEPNAALPDERMEVVSKFHDAGIPTWISLEPVLNPESALEIIGLTHEYTDLFKIGKLNHHKLAERYDWGGFALKAMQACESRNQPYYMKDDLAAFLSIPLGQNHVTVEDIEASAEKPPELQPAMF